jgi:hypothetical protein
MNIVLFVRCMLLGLVSAVLDWLLTAVSILNTELKLHKVLHFITVTVKYWDNDWSSWMKMY